MEQIKFEELYLIPSNNGVSRPSSVRGEGFHMVNMGELFNHDIINEMSMERVKLSDKEKEKFLLEKGDLLFARQSLVASGAGKCSYIDKIIEPTTYESHLIRVRLDKNKCCPLYYFYLFKLPYNPIKTIVNQCAQAGIRGSELKKIKVPKLPLNTQEKIASILYAYDKLIENNHKRIKVLEQMAENLYKEWFVRFRFPGHENTEFVDGIPKSWEYDKLEKLCSFVRGKNITAEVMDEGEIPVISAGLAPSGYHKEANVRGPSITISSSGANAGFLSFHEGDIWAADCSYVSGDKVNNIYYIYQLLNNMRDIVTNLQRGAAQPHVYPRDVNRLKVLIPSLDLQDKANKIFAGIYHYINKLQKQNKNLARQRDLLLPRLMSGKLEVKPD